MNETLSRIAAFGIELRALEEAGLPLVCYWRNHPEILPYMDDPRPTDFKVLRTWLKRVHSGGSTLPYLAYLHDQPVAYTEIKHINRENNTCEGGMFLFGEDYIGTGMGYNIVLCREVIMDKLHLKTFKSRIHIKNTRSINFCTKYGGEYSGCDGDFSLYTYEFSKRRERLKAIAGILGMRDEFVRYFEGGRE